MGFKFSVPRYLIISTVIKCLRTFSDITSINKVDFKQILRKIFSQFYDLDPKYLSTTEFLISNKFEFYFETLESPMGLSRMLQIIS